MADILTSKIQVPSLPDDTLILKDAEARNDLSTALATATGNPLNFSTRSAQKAKETVISLEPIQDLHGYDHPWSAGGGKNKFNPVNLVSSSTPSGTGLTITNNGDGSLTFTGTALRTDLIPITQLFGVPDGSYKAVVLNSERCTVVGYNGTTYTRLADSFTGVAEFQTSSSYISYIIQVGYTNGKTYNDTYFPMIMVAAETDPTFAPYSNYCPITGHTEVSVKVTNGKESTDPDYEVATDLTKDLGQEVFGGSYNPVSGELVVNIGHAVFDGTQEILLDFIDDTMCRCFYSLAGTKTTTDTSNIDTEVSSNYLVATSNMNTFKGFMGIHRRANGTEQICISLGKFGLNLGIDNGVEFNQYLASNPLSVCYPLATPITYHLSPHQVSLLEGVNTIWTDGTSIKVSYRDGKVATLGDLEDAANNLQEQIDQNETMEDETTQLLYKLGVNSGLLFMEEV